MPGALASSASERYFTGLISPGFCGGWAGPGRSWVASTCAGMSLEGSEQRRDVT